MWSIPALCLLIVPYIQAQTLIVTNGTSGETCPVKKCLADIADCIGGDTCVCRPPKTLDINNGHFGCYRTNNVFGEAFNDPKIRTFNNQTIDFPFPCRYLLTSVSTNLRVDKQVVGRSICQLSAFNGKYRGKLFIEGFDISCNINNTVLKQTLDFAIRVTGRAQNGVYTYSESGATAYLPDGPFDGPPVDVSGAGITVKSYVDPVNNQFVFAVPEIGWAVTFVAYDIAERLAQDQIPGISFAINCALDPGFHEHDRVIALAPLKFGGSLLEDLPGVPPLTTSQALVKRGFTSNVPQTQPNAPAQCTSIGDYLNLCPTENLKVAADRCFWITEKPRFARCLDLGSNIEPVVYLYDMCVSHFCVGYPTCNELVNIFNDSNCENITNIPQLTDITSGSICNV